MINTKTFKSFFFGSLVSLLCINFTESLVFASLAVGEAKKEVINKSVFKVFGSGAPGSGVLIILPDRKAAILTSKHVVQSMGKEEIIEIEYGNNKFLEIKKQDSIDIPDLDLSILFLNRDSLEQDNSFNFIGTTLEVDGITSNKKVFVAGFPLSGQSVSKNVRISNGNIQVVDNVPNKDGYDIGYSSATYVGMSGGGVFSEEGKLIGIHGRGERIESSDVNKTGTNFAVSIKKVIDFYRREIMKLDNTSSLNMVEASRQIFFRDFKSALTSWSELAERYPDSLVATYNKACLNQIVNKITFDKSEFPLIFNAESKFLGPAMNNYSSGKGIAYTLVNDPLVKEAWKGWTAPQGFMSTTLLSLIANYITHFQNPNNFFRQHQIDLPNYLKKGGCELFSTYKPIGGEYSVKTGMFLPVIPLSYVNDNTRP